MQSCNNYFSQKPSNLKYHKCTFSFSTVNYKITSFSASNSFSFLPYHFYKLIFFTKFVTFIAIPIKWCWFLKRATYCFSNHLSFLFTYFEQAHNRSTCICVCVCVCVYGMIKRARSPLSEGLRYGPQRTRRIKTTFTQASRSATVTQTHPSNISRCDSTPKTASFIQTRAGGSGTSRTEAEVWCSHVNGGQRHL